MTHSISLSYDVIAIFSARVWIMVMLSHISMAMLSYISMAMLSHISMAMLSHISMAMLSHISMAMLSHISMAMLSHISMAMLSHISMAMLSHIYLTRCFAVPFQFGVMRVPSSGGQYSSLAQQLFQEQPAQQEVSPRVNLRHSHSSLKTAAILLKKHVHKKIAVL